MQPESREEGKKNVKKNLEEVFKGAISSESLFFLRFSEGS